MSTELAWFKSSYSNDDGGNCVEVATCPHTIHVRDSKDLTEPELAFPVDAWTSFLTWRSRPNS